MTREKKDRVSLALFPSTIRALDDLAAEEGRTRSNMAERILSRYLMPLSGDGLRSRPSRH